MIKYTNKGGTSMSYFNVVLGNKDDMHHIRIYQRNKFPSMREGLSYKFLNLIKKPDALWAVQSTSIMMVPPVATHISKDNCGLPEEEPSSGKKRSIEEALMSPQKSVVKAKVMKVSPLAMKCEGALPVRCLALKDNTGKAKVALFQDLAKNSYVEGTVVELSGLYNKTWEGRRQLVASHITECELLPSSEMNVSIEEDDLVVFENDSDFGQASKNENLTVSGLFDVHVYDCCTYEGCHKKKLVDGICPICSGSENKKTCRVELEVTKENGSTVKINLFEKDVFVLFGILDFKQDKTELMLSMLSVMPIKFKGVCEGKSVINIQK